MIVSTLLIVKFFLLSSILLPFVQLQQQSVCPEGEYFNRDYALCYEFTRDTSVLTYDEAAESCTARGKKLAAVENPLELDFIAVTMRNASLSQVFVGLKYLKTGWKWTETDMPLRGQGCQQSTYSEDPEDDMPSIISNSMTIETCINYCSSETYLYAAVQQRQFCYCSQKFVWPTAASDCSMPCSGSSDQECGALFNSNTFFAAENSFDNWKKGRPTVYGSCGAIEIDRNRNPWVDNSCSVTLPFICGFENSTVTPDGAELFQCGDDICYYLYTTPTASWVNAGRFCLDQGGHLATIKSNTRQEIINRLLFSSTVAQGTLIWIGTANYQWFHSGGSGNQLSFDAWINVNEPVAPETYPCAAAAVTFDGKFGLKSTGCEDMSESDHRFVCVSPAVGVTPLLTTTTKQTTQRPTRPTPQRIVDTTTTTTESNQGQGGSQDETTPTEESK